MGMELAAQIRGEPRWRSLIYGDGAEIFGAFNESSIWQRFRNTVILFVRKTATRETQPRYESHGGAKSRTGALPPPSRFINSLGAKRLMGNDPPLPPPPPHRPPPPPFAMYAVREGEPLESRARRAAVLTCPSSRRPPSDLRFTS